MNLIKNKRKRKEKVEPLNSKRRKKEREKKERKQCFIQYPPTWTKVSQKSHEPTNQQSKNFNVELGGKTKRRQMAEVFLYLFFPENPPPTPPLPLIPDSQSPTPNSYLLISSHLITFLSFFSLASLFSPHYLKYK